ncbi:MAG: dockerin type I domain-containing protein [Planctomycetota bacterium]|nr:dockerin type I domain-containing protein [Planctomycetota bacterium]
MLRLESLESRRVFATASLSAGMLSIDLNQTDEVAYLYNDGTSLRLSSSQLASELSFGIAAVTSIQVTDTTLRTGQSFSLSYGLPLSLSGSMSVSQIETVVFGSELTVSGASGLSVTESQSIQVRAPLSTTGDPIVFGARDGITITHPVITNGGNQTFDADNDADGVGALSLDFPVKEFTDPNPNAGNNFGNGVLVLPSGNVVVTSPNDDAGGTNAGAVYLFNGMTGSLISTLRGSSASDQVGNTGLVRLTNGNYVVRSSNWDSGGITNVGAVTWGSGVLGVSGSVSSSNSLVGSTVADNVGSFGVQDLTNGNYVVRSVNWDSGPITNVGAFTWGNGTSGISGVVSSSNSFVGQTANQGTSWSITTATNLDAFLLTNTSDGSGRVVLGSSSRGFSLPSTPAGSLQAANGSVSLSVAGTNLQGTISSNANVSIAPSQTARQIDLGSKPSGILGLTDTELDWIAAANLRIGNSTSGDLSISSPISRATSTAMQLTSGGAIVFGSGAQSTSGAIHTAGGTLTLDAGTTVRPVTPGVDANTSAFSFAAGDTLQIDITGATVDSQYSQLSVVGPVTLTGVTLSLSSNFPAMIGTETFTIVNATGGVTGQFSGLNQGGAISVGSFAYTVNYTANSVELVPAIAPAITQSPSNQTVVTGNTATFTAAATGTPTPTVQWQVSTNGGASWSDISNAANTTYSFTAVSGDNGNQYRAVFTNTAGSATSSAAVLSVVTLDVSRGQVQRSYVRYLDITTGQNSDASQIVSSSRIRLRKADLNGNGSVNVPLTGLLSANGANISVDFGAAGIQNSRNTNGGDGYYTLELDLDNDTVFETSLRFYRLLGDVNGDRQVNSADQNAVSAASGTSNPQFDLNGDGIVNSTDVLMVRRAVGRRLANGLVVDD